ncbi:MAG: amidase, partial [Pseudomonadota bacterium]
MSAHRPRSKDDLTALGAAELVEGIAGGAYTSLDAVEALLARIEEVEPKVHAWAHLDPEFARAQGRE